MERFGPLRGHWIGDSEPGPTVVMLHGFGAPGSDLVGLASELGLPPQVRFLFLEGHLEMPPPYGGGRAWWMIDMERFQKAVHTGDFDALEREIPEGLAEARDKLASALAALHDRGVTRWVLGGFSQGSMLALDHTLHAERRPDALVLMSSTLLARDVWRPRMAALAGTSAFLSHGEFDPVLPFVQAQKLRLLMEEAGLDVDWHPFPGEHGVPRQVIQHLNPFLTSQLQL